MRCLLQVALVVLAASAANAWYIPGVSPYSYIEGESVLIKVNSLTSTEGIMPYPFYSVKTCEPSKEDIKRLKRKENLGEILGGEQIEPSFYFAEMKKDVMCRKLCESITMTPAEMKMWEKRIENGYKGNMVLDNLPVAMQLPGNNPLAPRVLTGYPLGLPKRLSPKKDSAVLNNHLQFKIGYHEPEFQPNENNTGYRIVYFYVTATTVKWNDADKECLENAVLQVNKFDPVSVKDQTVTFTYSVEWIEEPNIVWATRWDAYMRGGEGEGRVHWSSIINSLIIVTMLSSLVAMIVLRALRKDIAKYNTISEEEKVEETGWKLVHGEVFRCPPNATWLITQVASGTQLLGTLAFVLCFACLGFLSPSNRGGLVTSAILIFVLLGSAAGYISARLFKTLDLQNWKRIFAVSLYFPGAMFSVYLFLNFFTWAEHSSSAVPFTTLLLLVSLWLVVSVSLTVIGAGYGFRQKEFKFPSKVSAVPREIPELRWYLRPEIAIPLGGTLPFGAAFIELLFIFSSIWQGRIYYVFGFLSLVFLLVIVTAAEVSIVYTYFQLISEEYRWWHRSYLVTASAGVHMFLYSTYYFHTAMQSVQQLSSIVLYFGYVAMMSLSFSLVCGAVGFIASFVFVTVIYNAVKID